MSPLTIEMPDGSIFDPSTLSNPVVTADDVERIRFSRLKLMALSPLHYAVNFRAATSSLDKGSAVHAILLGGKRVTFYDRVTDSGRAAPRNGKAWEEFQAANADAIVLSQSEYDDTNRMVDAVRAHEFAMSLITPAKGRKIEDTILFNALGMPARTTPDARTKDTVVELKTCKSSRPVDFAYQSRRLSYHAQMAFHVEGMCSLNPALEPTAYTIAVESSGVPAVTVFRTPPAVLLEGHKMIRAWLEQLKTCTESNIWPAYSQAVVDLELPGMGLEETDE